MFSDVRSKKIVLVTHCFLNQNSISDGTADFPSSIYEVVEVLLKANVGILQMPCPEFLCLGLDRGNVHGCEQPVVVENTRIREALGSSSSARTLKAIVDQLVFQIEEYQKHGFSILGILGINRSPSCGIDTTSANNQEVKGEGVLMKLLHEELTRKNIHIQMIGIKGQDIGDAVERVKKLCR